MNKCVPKFNCDNKLKIYARILRFGILIIKWTKIVNYPTNKSKQLK